MTYEIKTLPLSAIRTNGGTQTRVQLNAAAVKEYGEAMTEGVHFPPVIVFFDGTDHWLADGFHRVQASMDIGALSITSEVRPGDQRAARLFSTGANGAHGVPPTVADKRRAVMTLLNDAEWATWSDRDVSRQCKVSHPFVAKMRASLETFPDSRPESSLETFPVSQSESSLETFPVSQPESSEKPAGRTYKTKHGTTATMKTDGVSKANKARATPADAPTVATPPERHDEAPGPVKVDKPAEQGEVERLRAELESAREFVAEQGANLQSLLDEVIELRKVCEADEKLAAAADVIKQKTAENRVLREQLNGSMATTVEAQRAAKSWRAKHDKLVKEIERARSV